MLLLPLLLLLDAAVSQDSTTDLQYDSLPSVEDPFSEQEYSDEECYFPCGDQLSCVARSQVCDGVVDCPRSEVTVGGEDEENCDFSGDYSNIPENPFEQPSAPPTLSFEDFIDVGREPQGLDNFVDVGTEPPNVPTFSEIPNVDIQTNYPVQEEFLNLEPVNVEDMCHTTTGQTNIVLDMFESFGDDYSQETNPIDLPVMGEPGRDIQLELVFPNGNSLFRLEGKSVRLREPLDRDESDLSSIVFQVTCTVLQSRKRKTIPVIVRVSDLNDNSPQFMNIPYSISLPEKTPVGTPVFTQLSAIDVDTGTNGLVEYSVVPGDGSSNDGFGYFTINLPHQGVVRVAKTLDYEKTTTYYVNIQASDRASDPSLRRSSLTVLTVNVEDSDDLPPGFSHPLYTCRVISGERAGVLDVQPDKIQAEDQDSLRSEISYSIVSGQPSFYSEYFSLDRRTGVVRQTRPMDRATAPQFTMTIMAEEANLNRRRAESQLIITIEAKDNFSPELAVSATDGFIDENSVLGTLVLDKGGNPITFTVSDRDQVSGATVPSYIYELTSAEFGRNDKSQLVVSRGGLDRDPPNQPMLVVQVVAREDLPGGKASSPVTIHVQLKDLNDNAPILPALPPAVIQAGNSRRKIAQMNATDIDEDDSIKYRILHVSNNGKRTFYVNPTTGDVEVLGNVLAGQSYSITIMATDASGASSQSILEVSVTSGPNVRPPYFDKLLYDVEVSEGAARHSSVATVSARDPEGATVTYSVASGDPEGHFSIGESTGVIRVMLGLDREDVRLYALTVRAADEEGKASTASVNIAVTDVNDQNPEFQNTPYSFRVKEGQVDAFVGRVFAEDADIGSNAVISYSLPAESRFSIDKDNGKISTKTALDFEKAQVHYVVVTAQDNAKVPRLATATATILVDDTSDEVPYFPKSQYEGTVPENTANFIVTTVEANDKDTLSQITYRIMEGDITKFTVDPLTGAVKTLQGLDYERAKEHKLVIGTEQSRGLKKDTNDSTCTLVIKVEDRNDIVPIFVRLPPGNRITVRNDAQLNDNVGKVLATDSDGTAPGNLVRYQLIGDKSSDKAEMYFRVDPDSGDIVLQGDLTNELYDEYRLAVKAYDQGQPSLEVVTTIVITVQQVVTVPPNSGVGFANLEHDITVMENTPQEAVLKTLVLEKKPSRNIRIRCEVTEARDEENKNVKSLFRGELDQNKDCQLILARSGLDHELVQRYRVVLTLNTLSAFVNPNRMKARVNVTVLDKNDNEPKFVYNSDYHKIVKEKYLASVTEETQAGKEIYRVEATDLDGGNLGQIKFDIAPETDEVVRRYFEINSDTGVVTSKKVFQDVPAAKLPFRLVIAARDNPGFMEDSKIEKTELVINLVREGFLMVLAVRGTEAETLNTRREEMTELLRDQTGLVVNIDRIVPSQLLDINGTCCTADPTGSDVWFYAVDPDTLELLEYNSTRTLRHITGKPAQTSLKYTITGDLHVQASEIRSPHLGNPFTTVVPTTAVTRSASLQYSGYPSVLIAVGCLVFALSFAAIIYLLVLYAKYKYAKDRSQRMVVIPRYEPVFVEPNLKEYETQVLQMSMAIDDHDSADLKLDFSSRSHVFDPAFNLDSVSYITHETSTSASPTSDSEQPASHSTFRGAAVTGRPVVRNPSNRANYLEQEQIPVYDKSSDSDGSSGHEGGVMNPSFTNDNVMFLGRKDYNTSTPKRASSFKSPIDATTQL